MTNLAHLDQVIRPERRSHSARPGASSGSARSNRLNMSNRRRGPCTNRRSRQPPMLNPVERRFQADRPCRIGGATGFEDGIAATSISISTRQSNEKRQRPRDPAAEAAECFSSFPGRQGSSRLPCRFFQGAQSGLKALAANAQERRTHRVRVPARLYIGAGAQPRPLCEHSAAAEPRGVAASASPSQPGTTHYRA